MVTDVSTRYYRSTLGSSRPATFVISPTLTILAFFRNADNGSDMMVYIQKFCGLKFYLQTFPTALSTHV